MVGFAYAIEFFIAWYGGNGFEQFAFLNRAFGPYAWAYWTMVTCNVIAPQLFWFKKFRTTPWLMVVVCVFVNIGMWFERFVITVTSLSRDFLPSSWGYYKPTAVDMLMFLGSFGLFFTLFLLFCRYLPMVAMAEVKAVMPPPAEQRDVPARWPPFTVAAGRTRTTDLCRPGGLIMVTSVDPSKDDASRPLGILAAFPTQYELLAACAEMRELGYVRLEAFSPFPIHGMDEALGVRPTRLPWFVLIAGIIGGVSALALQWWTNAIDYPYLISGKPLFSLPANIPVTFEVIILLAAFAAFFGMLALNGLPKLANPLLRNPSFRAATTMAFSYWSRPTKRISIRSPPSRALLGVDATHVEALTDVRNQRGCRRALLMAGAVIGALALLPPVMIASARSTKSEKPRLHNFFNMDFQPKFKSQTTSTLFTDGRAMRPRVSGTVPRGQLKADAGFYYGIAENDDREPGHRDAPRRFTSVS